MFPLNSFHPNVPPQYICSCADLPGSKLEELQREVLSIKEAVGKSVATNLSSSGINHSSQALSLGNRGALTDLQARPLSRSITVNPSPPTSTSSPHFVNGRVPQPRALKSRVFSGEDIGLYFQRSVLAIPLQKCYPINETGQIL